MTQQERLEAPQDLASDAIHQARKLITAELSLAKSDLQRAANDAARSALAFGVAGVVALAGIETLALSVALADRHGSPARTAAVGFGLLGLAAAAALVGRASLPRSPLPTVSRIASDLEDVAERAGV